MILITYTSFPNRPFHVLKKKKGLKKAEASAVHHKLFVSFIFVTYNEHVVQKNKGKIFKTSYNTCEIKPYVKKAAVCAISTRWQLFSTFFSTLGTFRWEHMLFLSLQRWYFLRIKRLVRDELYLFSTRLLRSFRQFFFVSEMFMLARVTREILSILCAGIIL